MPHDQWEHETLKRIFRVALTQVRALDTQLHFVCVCVCVLTVAMECVECLRM